MAVSPPADGGRSGIRNAPRNSVRSLMANSRVGQRESLSGLIDDGHSNVHDALGWSCPGTWPSPDMDRESDRDRHNLRGHSTYRTDPYVSYRREGGRVTATAVSEEVLAEPRESLDGFVPTIDGSRSGDPAPEPPGPGSDPGAEGTAASAQAYRRLSPGRKMTVTSRRCVKGAQAR